MDLLEVIRSATARYYQPGLLETARLKEYLFEKLDSVAVEFRSGLEMIDGSEIIFFQLRDPVQKDKVWRAYPALTRLITFRETESRRKDASFGLLDTEANQVENFDLENGLMVRRTV